MAVTRTACKCVKNDEAYEVKGLAAVNPLEQRNGNKLNDENVKRVMEGGV